MQDQKRILIVDDEPANRDLLEALLMGMGHNTESVADGFQALARLSLGFDLVLLDVRMPGMNGFEVARRIRSGEECPDIPICMVTSLSGKEDRLRAIEAGASDFITKPIDKTELKVRTASLLRTKAVQDSLKRHQAELEDLARRRKMLLHLLRHDIANVVSGAIALLERKKTTIEQFSLSELAILAMLVHCEGVIQDVRAREQEALAASGLQAANLRTLVEETCTVLGAQAGPKGLTIASDINPDIYVQVRPGPFVVHVLNNILRNAIKFSYPGGVIKVSATVEDAVIAVVFRDFGCGIPQSRLEDIFEKPSTTVGTAGEIGTGYGLRHVRECLREIGGSISIESVCRADNGTGPVALGTSVTIRVARADQ